MNAIRTAPKRTRQERKQASRAYYAQLDKMERTKAERRAQFEREHPILSGAVKIVDYVAPRGTYTAA